MTGMTEAVSAFSHRLAEAVGFTTQALADVFGVMLGVSTHAGADAFALRLPDMAFTAILNKFAVTSFGADIGRCFAFHDQRPFVLLRRDWPDSLRAMATACLRFLTSGPDLEPL